MPKKFDRKEGFTFNLVHRSQQDPLAFDEKAPQRVWLPVEDKNAKKRQKKRLDEQHKYGIYFDDDFNYLQHLKDVKDNEMEWPEHAEKQLAERRKKYQLMLSGAVEEDVGMLNKAAPVSELQLNPDPDIVAAMDEDFNYSDQENQLEDNFIELANGVVSDQEFDAVEEIEIDSNFDKEEMDEGGSLAGLQQSFNKEETKSRFTNHSLTSSVIRRTEQLTLLDRRFEKFYESYDDSKIGALESDEIEDYSPDDTNLLLQYAEEFENSQKRQQLDRPDPSVIEKTKQLLLEQESDEEEFVDVPIQEKPKLDCESMWKIRASYDYQPKIIEEPKKEKKIIIDKRSGIPKDVLGSHKLTTKALNSLNEQNNAPINNGPGSEGGQTMTSLLSMLSVRPKDETPEEKRERKNKLKEYRRERKKEKKLNKLAFIEEEKRQKKISINNRNNVQGNRIL